MTGALSDLAETTLDLAISHLLARAVARNRALRPEAVASPDASGLIVLGMGKLGARELNYSSDIDLIVFYDADKVPTDRPDDLGQIFSRITRELVRIMEERTVRAAMSSAPIYGCGPTPARRRRRCRWPQPKATTPAWRRAGSGRQ